MQTRTNNLFLSRIPGQKQGHLSATGIWKHQLPALYAPHFLGPRPKTTKRSDCSNVERRSSSTSTFRETPSPSSFSRKPRLPQLGSSIDRFYSGAPWKVFLLSVPQVNSFASWFPSSTPSPHRASGPIFPFLPELELPPRQQAQIKERSTSYRKAATRASYHLQEIHLPARLQPASITTLGKRRRSGVAVWNRHSKTTTCSRAACSGPV